MGGGLRDEDVGRVGRSYREVSRKKGPAQRSFLNGYLPECKVSSF